ncbi:N-acetyltransferase [Staphylococcus saprophyticus]|uniref:N-acetyltransferase n=1 Tax=Staphylococcus saprophyticus TaxID=29385 RepID=UPI0021B4875C|nr:N-acetyltransferase [Staphylococcus saprophyticus]
MGDEENNGEAEITFNQQNHNQIHIHHTRLPEQMRPQAIPSHLVKPLLHYPPHNNLKLSPTSPFPKTLIQKHHQYQHLYLP